MQDKVVRTIPQAQVEELKEKYAEAIKDPDDEIATDEFESKFTEIFKDYPAGDFLNSCDIYFLGGWGKFCLLVEKQFNVNISQFRGRPPVKKSPGETPEDIKKILKDSSLSDKEKVFQLKQLGLTRKEVLKTGVAHFTYIYKLWRL
jgi:hypothetical protein